MFACLEGVDGDIGVPRVGRGDGDGVDVLSFEELPVVLEVKLHHNPLEHHQLPRIIQRVKERL